MFSFFLLSEQSSRISSIVFSVGKHALQKTAYLLNQTFYSFAVYIKAYIYGNISGPTDKYKFDEFFNLKNASEMNAKNTPPT